ncbi:MAG TPA: hypothetical protein VME66_09845 [Candidatus Acidoferrales bacterium]|nr:hypothetical protein [Candidatus Acidoferrales bacterium]
MDKRRNPGALPYYALGAACVAVFAAAGSLARASTPVEITANGGANSAWTAFVAADAQIQTCTEVVDAYEVAGTKSQRRRYQMYFRKPNLVRAEIIGGDGAGSVAVWRGGNTVRAHRGGFLAFLTLTLPENDPRVVDDRGDTVDAPFFPSIIGLFQQIGDISEGPEETIDGVDTDPVSVTPPDPSKYGGATKITLYLSQATHLPVARRSWEGERLVEDVHFSDQRVNVDVPVSKFAL